MQRTTGPGYDQALRTVRDLMDADEQAGTPLVFQARLGALMVQHGKRRPWVDRLVKSDITWTMPP